VNRRHLFNLLVGAALAPELLVKPAKTYFLPPRRGWFLSDLRPGHVLTVEDIRRAKRMLALQQPEQPYYVMYQNRVWFAKNEAVALSLLSDFNQSNNAIYSEWHAGSI